MRQRGGSEQPVKRRRASRPKPRKVSTAASSIADLQTQVGALTRELKEALERQTASVEVLQVINTSPGDLAPVFDAILEKAHRLCAVSHGSLMLYDGETSRAVAARGLSEAFAAYLRQGFVPGPNLPHHQLLEGARFAQVPNWAEVDDPTARGALGAGVPTTLYIPLRRKGQLLGYITAARPEVRPFSEKEIALLESFAAQAVIAIENARLFNETTEALERQTTTADILKVIASSPSDQQPVFDAIVNSAARLFESCTATITTMKDGKLHWNASATLRSDFDVSGAKVIYPIPLDPDRAPSARAILERRIIEVPDTDAPDTPEFTRKAGAAAGIRSNTYVPLVHRDIGIGVIILSHPQPGFRLTEKQLALVQTFADQAVIAIENARLFEQVQAKTRSRRIPSTADRNVRSASGHQFIARRSDSRIREDAGERDARLRRGVRGDDLG
jgi:GAF domain-containing protein